MHRVSEGELNLGSCSCYSHRRNTNVDNKCRPFRIFDMHRDSSVQVDIFHSVRYNRSKSWSFHGFNCDSWSSVTHCPWNEYLRFILCDDNWCTPNWNGGKHPILRNICWIRRKFFPILGNPRMSCNKYIWHSVRNSYNEILSIWPRGWVNNF